MVLSPQMPLKPKSKEYGQDRRPKALDFGLICWGGGDGAHISPPPPGSVSLGWCSSCFLGLCKDFWAVPDPGFTVHELLPVYRSAGKTYFRSAGRSHGLMTQITVQGKAQPNQNVSQFNRVKHLATFIALLLCSRHCFSPMRKAVWRSG